VSALLVVGAMLTGGFPSDPTGDRAGPATTRATAAANSGEKRAAPASTRGGVARVIACQRPPPGQGNRSGRRAALHVMSGR